MPPYPDIHDPKHPDMSPEAIDRRLRELARLYKFGMALRHPKWIWRGNIIESAEAANERPLADTESLTTVRS